MATIPRGRDSSCGTEVIHAHPRFLVSCLGLAAKPKRLLIPAFALTASSGFRPLRAALEGRDEEPALRGDALGLPVAFELLAWPFALRPPPMRQRLACRRGNGAAISLCAIPIAPAAILCRSAWLCAVPLSV